MDFSGAAAALLCCVESYPGLFFPPQQIADASERPAVSRSLSDMKNAAKITIINIESATNLIPNSPSQRPASLVHDHRGLIVMSTTGHSTNRISPILLLNGCFSNRQELVFAVVDCQTGSPRSARNRESQVLSRLTNMADTMNPVSEATVMRHASPNHVGHPVSAGTMFASIARYTSHRTP